MNAFLERATRLKDEMTAARRVIHQNGGVGFDLRENADFIMARLREMGIEPREICPCGIVATIGTGGKTVLLRADYDALPLAEESGLPFAATNGSCHACGHDFNAVSLLYAAKMLKEREGELKGTVKLMFQPAEELGKGAKAMIDAGLLENPAVDVAFGLHMGIGEDDCSLGDVAYTRGPRFAAADKINIIIKGRGGHGAFPSKSIDPITTAARVILGLQNIIPMEIDSAQRAILTFGAISGGKANNSIPDEVQLAGTLRTLDEDVRAFMRTRIREIATGIAQAMRCEAVVNLDEGSIPAATMDPALCDAMHASVEEIATGTVHVSHTVTAMGSEDFAEISSRVPAMSVQAGAGSPKEGYHISVHNPKVLFNEDCLIQGAALFANLAFNWLKDNATA